MDHRISKDMISSGMIPSGEKKQEDLSRTQYGTAPSPNALSDVYKKMYETKEEVINEHHKKDADGNTIPHEGEELNEAKVDDTKIFNVAGDRNVRRFGKEGQFNPAGSGPRGQGTSEKAKLAVKRGEEHKARRGVKTGTDTYTPSGTMEEVDKFDVVFNHFINEGHTEKEAYSKMANLTEEQLDEFMKMLAAKAAQYGANLGQKTKIDAIGGIKRKPFEPVVKRKPFDAKPKPGEQGFKAKSASEVISSVHASRRKPEPIVQKKEEPKPQQKEKPKPTVDKRPPVQGPVTSITAPPIKRNRSKQIMQDEYQYIDEYAQFLAKGAALLSKAIKPVANAAKTVKKTVSNVVKDPTVQNIATQTAVGAVMNSGGGGQKERSKQVSTAQYQSADLFDIVKGQLLDEGLSEEEIKDIMLTLTPDEIMKEMNQGPSTPVKNYGEPGKPKILPNSGAKMIARVKTTDKGNVIKGGQDTGKKPSDLM